MALPTSSDFDLFDWAHTSAQVTGSKLIDDVNDGLLQQSDLSQGPSYIDSDNIADGDVRIKSHDGTVATVTVDLNIPTSYTLEFDVAFESLPNDFEEPGSAHVFIGVIDLQGSTGGLLFSKAGIIARPLAGLGAAIPNALSGSQGLILPFTDGSDNETLTVRLVVDGENGVMNFYATVRSSLEATGHVLRHTIAAPKSTGATADSVIIEAAGGGELGEANILLKSLRLAGTLLLPNLRPVITLPDDIATSKGATVLLDGSDSSDPEGADLTYKWSLLSQPAGAATELSGAVNASATHGAFKFTTPYGDGQAITIVRPNAAADSTLQLTVAADNAITITLRHSTGVAQPNSNVVTTQQELLDALTNVDDGAYSVDVAELIGVEKRENYVYEPIAPVIDAAANSTVSLVLSGAVASAEQKPVFYPLVPGVYEFQLVVSDGTLASLPDTILVNVLESSTEIGSVPDGGVIWNYLSDFWNLVQDKDKISTYWSAMIQVIGAEMLRLWQIDYSKSLQNIPRRFTHKWVGYSAKYEPTVSSFHMVDFDTIANTCTRVDDADKDVTSNVIQFAAGELPPSIVVGDVAVVHTATGPVVTTVKTITAADNTMRLVDDVVDIYEIINSGTLNGRAADDELGNVATTSIFGLSHGIFKNAIIKEDDLLWIDGQTLSANLPAIDISESSNTELKLKSDISLGENRAVSWQVLRNVLAADISVEFSPYITLSEDPELNLSVGDAVLVDGYLYEEDPAIGGFKQDAVGNLVLDPLSKYTFSGVVLGNSSKKVAVRITTDLPKAYAAMAGEDYTKVKEAYDAKAAGDELTPEQEVLLNISTDVWIFNKFLRTTKIPLEQEIDSIPRLQSTWPEPNDYAIAKWNADRNYQSEALDYVVDTDASDNRSIKFTPTAKSDGVYSINTSEFSSASLDYDSVEVGNVLYIHFSATNPDDCGQFVITAVDSVDKNLTLDYTFGASATAVAFSILEYSFHESTNPPDIWWAEYTYEDNAQTIENNFGILVGFEKSAVADFQVDYLSSVKALWFALWGGPTVSNIELGGQVFFNLPFAEVAGKIFDIQTSISDTQGRLVIQDLADANVFRSYFYPKKLGLSINPSTEKTYTTGDLVEVFAPLTLGVEVQDYVNTPDWYKGYLTGADELKKFHTFKVEVDLSAVDDTKAFDLMIKFAKRIKPAHTNLMLVGLQEIDDAISVTAEPVFGTPVECIGSGEAFPNQSIGNQYWDKSFSAEKVVLPKDIHATENKIDFFKGWILTPSGGVAQGLSKTILSYDPFHVLEGENVHRAVVTTSKWPVVVSGKIAEDLTDQTHLKLGSEASALDDAYNDHTIYLTNRGAKQATAITVQGNVPAGDVLHIHLPFAVSSTGFAATWKIVIKTAVQIAAGNKPADEIWILENAVGSTVASTIVDAINGTQNAAYSGTLNEGADVFAKLQGGTTNVIDLTLRAGGAAGNFSNGQGASCYQVDVNVNVPTLSTNIITPGSSPTAGFSGGLDYVKGFKITNYGTPFAARVATIDDLAGGQATGNPPAHRPNEGTSYEIVKQPNLNDSFELCDYSKPHWPVNFVHDDPYVTSDGVILSGTCISASADGSSVTLATGDPSPTDNAYTGFYLRMTPPTPTGSATPYNSSQMLKIHVYAYASGAGDTVHPVGSFDWGSNEPAADNVWTYEIINRPLFEAGAIHKTDHYDGAGNWNAATKSLDFPFGGENPTVTLFLATNMPAPGLVEGEDLLVHTTGSFMGKVSNVFTPSLIRMDLYGGYLFEYSEMPISVRGRSSGTVVSVAGVSDIVWPRHSHIDRRRSDVWLPLDPDTVIGPSVDLPTANVSNYDADAKTIDLGGVASEAHTYTNYMLRISSSGEYIRIVDYDGTTATLNKEIFAVPADASTCTLHPPHHIAELLGMTFLPVGSKVEGQTKGRKAELSYVGPSYVRVVDTDSSPYEAFSRGEAIAGAGTEKATTLNDVHYVTPDLIHRLDRHQEVGPESHPDYRTCFQIGPDGIGATLDLGLVLDDKEVWQKPGGFLVPSFGPGIYWWTDKKLVYNYKDLPITGPLQESNVALLVHFNGISGTSFPGGVGALDKSIHAHGHFVTADRDAATKKLGGASASFNGTTDYGIFGVTMGDSGEDLEPESITLMAWVRHSSDPSNDLRYLFYRGATSAMSGYSLYQSQTKLTFTATASTGIPTAQSTKSWGAGDVNVWRHVVATYDGAEVKIYIDGALDKTKAEPDGDLVYSTTSAIAIGASRDGQGTANNLFEGHMDEVIILKSALSASEIQDIYDDQVAGKEYKLEGALVEGQEVLVGEEWTPVPDVKHDLVNGDAGWNSNVLRNVIVCRVNSLVEGKPPVLSPFPEDPLLTEIVEAGWDGNAPGGGGMEG